jgi:hypothetical protein
VAETVGPISSYSLGVVPASSSVPPDPGELARLRERFAWLTDTDEDDLPSLWAAVLLRMRDHGLIRGHGSVPGELAETLVARWYGGALQPQSTAHVDLVTPGARRIQVKALRYSNPGRSSIASFGRAVRFDELAVVRFEYDMRVRDALLLDADYLRVPSDDDPSGVLTPAGNRLSTGQRLLEVAEGVAADDLWRRGGGQDRDIRLSTGGSEARGHA